MWKKTFIRSTLIGMVILACLLVFATTHLPQQRTVPSTCTKSQQEDCEKKTQSDFIIWESLGRTLMTNIQY